MGKLKQYINGGKIKDYQQEIKGLMTKKPSFEVTPTEFGVTIHEYEVDDAFRPTLGITRTEMLALIINAYKTENPNVSDKGVIKDISELTEILLGPAQ